jgi:hypothetical protein
VALVVYAHRLSKRAQIFVFVFACGVAAGLALLFPAVLNLRNMLADTPGVFEVSFGLWSFWYASFTSQYPWLPNVIQLALMLAMAGLIAWSRRWSA